MVLQFILIMPCPHSTLVCQRLSMKSTFSAGAVSLGDSVITEIFNALLSCSACLGDLGRCCDTALCTQPGCFPSLCQCNKHHTLNKTAFICLIQFTTDANLREHNSVCWPKSSWQLKIEQNIYSALFYVYISSHGQPEIATFVFSLLFTDK